MASTEDQGTGPGIYGRGRPRHGASVKARTSPGAWPGGGHSTSGVEGRGLQLKVEVVPVWSWPVRVNVVSPGIIKTPVHPAGSYEELGGRLPPLGRGRPGQRCGGRRLVPGGIALLFRDWIAAGYQS